EDGIRDFHVTGVQTCALPISSSRNVDFSFTCSASIKSDADASCEQNNTRLKNKIFILTLHVNIWAWENSVVVNRQVQVASLSRLPARSGHWGRLSQKYQYS